MSPSAGASGLMALSRWQIVGLAGTALLVAAAIGTVAWRMTSGPAKASARKLTADETRLLAKAEEERTRRQNEARKLKQADIGSGYQVDGEGNLVGPSEATDLPANQSLEQVGRQDDSEKARTAIGGAIHGGHAALDGDEPSGTSNQGDEEKVQRAELEKPMLGYTTVKTAKWATRRPEVPDENADSRTADKSGGFVDAVDRAVGSAERRLSALKDGPGLPSGLGSGSAAAPIGPAKRGSDLMPAEEEAQPFAAGNVGDMRIGGEAGSEQTVRQGKFLDCVLVNEVRADLVESPVIAMVSRDFVSLDGAYVLVPAGAKLIGTAGRVQNLQQARVYIRFDRVIFPDQRSAYFPVRKLAAVDGAGRVGVEGDVDRHFMLTFGSAVMLGMLDGLAAAVEGGNSSATPTARELILARSSMNMSQVVAGILARYGNVVPTVTVEAGSKMKVFFAEDVRMTPYMRVQDLRWRGGRR